MENWSEQDKLRKVQTELTNFGILAAALLAWRLGLTKEVDRNWIAKLIAEDTLIYEPD